MKKTFLIALVTVLCAGGAFAQNTSNSQQTTNPGGAKQKNPQSGNTNAGKGKDIHNDEKEKGATGGSTKGKDVHATEKSPKGGNGNKVTEGTKQDAHQKHAVNDGNGGANGGGTHHKTITAQQPTQTGVKAK